MEIRILFKKKTFKKFKVNIFYIFHYFHFLLNYSKLSGIKLHYGVGLSQYIGGIISINSGLNIIYSGLNIMHSGINLIYSVGLTYMVDPHMRVFVKALVLALCLFL